MPTWELFKAVAEGAYIKGDTFVNEAGERIVFNGHVLVGSDEINPHDTWEFEQ